MVRSFDVTRPNATDLRNEQRLDDRSTQNDLELKQSDVWMPKVS
jgi:hypothetical protein